MSLLQKLALAAAIAGVLAIILRKAWAYERFSRAANIPTLRPVQDAKPDVVEPLTADPLRVAQNSPL